MYGRDCVDEIGDTSVVEEVQVALWSDTFVVFISASNDEIVNEF
jgi:hypothetical protein